MLMHFPCSANKPNIQEVIQEGIPAYHSKYFFYNRRKEKHLYYNLSLLGRIPEKCMGSYHRHNACLGPPDPC
jgi:hypothetical protein